MFQCDQKIEKISQFLRKIKRLLGKEGAKYLHQSSI